MTPHSMPQAAGALKRASRGGMLVGSQLLAISTTLTAGQRLQRSVLQGAKAAGSTGVRGIFAVLSSRVKVSVIPAVVILHHYISSLHHCTTKFYCYRWLHHTVSLQYIIYCICQALQICWIGLASHQHTD